MFKKDLTGHINHKSHVQKKYFSLMLVPSFSSGKTRSIKIPYIVFHITAIFILTVAAVVCGVYMRSRYYENAALQVEETLDEAKEAYNELQANLKTEQSRLLDEQNRWLNEQNRLLDGQNQLKEQLTEAEIKKQTEVSTQSQNYRDNLNNLQEQMEDMERQLQELDSYRLEALDKLEVKAYIPPVKDILVEATYNQALALSYSGATAISSDERSRAAYATEEDLQDYFTIFALKKEVMAQNYAELESTIEEAIPHIKSYPTKRPVNGKRIP